MYLLLFVVVYLLLFVVVYLLLFTKVVYYYYAFVCNFTCLFSYMYTYQLVVGELGTTYICLDATKQNRVTGYLTTYLFATKPKYCIVH